MQKENKEGAKEGTDDFGSDLDTDGFRVSGLEGLERDKRGELVVLLPDEERTLARQRGFFMPAARGEAADASGAKHPVEKGTQFIGVLAEKPLAPPAPEETPAQPEETATKPPTGFVDYGPTQVLIPDALGKKAGPSVGDFNLDFGSGAATAARRKREADAAPPDEKAPGKIKKTAAWEAPKVEKPMPPPSAAVAPKKPSKEEIPFDEPELPDDYSAPIVVKRRRTEKPEEKPEQPEPARIKARSYLDDELVIEEPVAKTPVKTTKKKMKLPKRAKEGGRKTSPLLVLMLVLLLLVLAAVIAVQYVPEAREYYDKLVAEIMNTKPAVPSETPGDTVKDNGPVIVVGTERVPLSKESDMKSAEAYVKSFREALRQGKAAVSDSGKAKK